MFDPAVTASAIAILAALSIGGLAYALLSPMFEKQERKERINTLAVGDRRAIHAGKAAAEDAATRRKSIASKLKQQQALIDEKSKKNASSKAPLNIRILRAGLTWTKRTYWMVAAMCALFMFAGLTVAGAPVFAGIAGAVIGFFGMPNWYISLKTKKRLKKFLEEYPNAIDVIVRGMKAGLPLNDCMLIISREAAEPVRSEFKRIVEEQQMGMQLNQAVVKMYERVPLSEVNFLAIMMTIQGQSGGNLSEPLGNLSTVVRDRKKMKAKIDAMSMEAKSSAGIIACLPVMVVMLIYLSTPDYITLLFTERLGNIMLGGCALLMLTGVLVMRKMINFDF